MVGRRGRWGKRKMDELQEGLDLKSKSAKEARIEAISLDASEPARITLQTLRPEMWAHQEVSDEWSEEHNSIVSQLVIGERGEVSQGTSWSPSVDLTPAQVALSCTRVPNGEAFDCETQTFHFAPVSVSKVVVVPESDAPGTIKVEIDTDQQEEFLSHPLLCCVEGCKVRSDTHTTATFYTVPKDEEGLIWSEMLDIIRCDEGDVRQHVCGKHFITPNKTTTKGKTRKKKTCDMLVAEEAERIRQGLTSGRPKRTPKLNKNYDWAEIAPLIKCEPDDLDELYLSSDVRMERAGGGLMHSQRQVPIHIKEDKENKRPSSETEEDILGDCEEEEDEEYLLNISLPSHPRAPPPKPKGRPHRIRDSGTQTEGGCQPSESGLVLREVKVQCNLNTEPPAPCTSCSYVNWLRLEELLVDCASKLEGELCAPQVQECLRSVVDSVPHPTHATNVLKLLSGDQRDAMEGTGDIILVANEEDEVEIENVIHTTVEEPITGVREIIPQAWQKRHKWKKTSTTTKIMKVEAVRKEEDEEEEEEEYLDGFGIKEATEIDDDEFNPEYFDGDETEEEDYQGLDDEDWTINKQDKDFKPGTKKKQKKTQQQHKLKKGQTPVAGEGQPGSHTSSYKKAKRIKRKYQKHSNRDGRSEDEEHQCQECDEVFTSSLEASVHRQQVHMAPATWHPNHQCSTCGQTFEEKRELYLHGLLLHGAPRRHQCDQCDYEAPRLFHLKRHMKVHTGERSHECEVCHKGLKSLHAYKNHMVLHTNVGKYRCDYCHKAFNQRTLYEDHCRTHSSDRCFSCKYCRAAFKTYKNVASHVRAVHLGDKRFICDVCGAQFMTGSNLKAHLKIHRASMPHSYHCDMCNASFRGLRGLTVHLKVLHGVTKEGRKEQGKAATSLHPTRRPQYIDYVIVGDVEEEGTGESEEDANRTYNTQGGNVSKIEIHGDGEGEEEGIRKQNEEEQERAVKEEDETRIQVVGGVEIREGFEMENLAEEEEEEDGRTVLVESENFVFRVKPEEIEFEL